MQWGPATKPLRIQKVPNEDEIYDLEEGGRKKRVKLNGVAD